ncbi:MAG TPA: hypothetical protein VJ625_15545, partial [Propionibacteriaceae bacterium]|nr:hypothetical protein [Propionibacteriaceae bacterium]
MGGVFEALIVVGLFLLIAVVGLATLVMSRRGRQSPAQHSTGVYQPGTGVAVRSASSASGATLGDPVDVGDAESGEEHSGSETE